MNTLKYFATFVENNNFTENLYEYVKELFEHLLNNLKWICLQCPSQQKYF